MNKNTLKILLAGILVVPAATVWGATDTSTLTVGATVASSCTVSSGAPLTFNVTDLTANTDATADITVHCTNGTTYDVGLDAGGGTGATTTTRVLTSTAASDTLNYQLFSESTRTTNWGNTVGTDTVSGTGTGADQTLTVYGRVPSGQTDASAATDYADSVTVTITY